MIRDTHRTRVLRIALSTLVWLALVVSAGWWPRAHADWPLPRADVGRTAVARGVGDLTSPAVYWRHYLGGAISSRGSLIDDIDGDGGIEVVFVSGGSLVAKEQDDSVLWQTPVYALSTVIGVRDFDGDGTREIAVRSNAQVLIVDLATGASRWLSPAGEFGFIDDVRITDLDGDGRDDLLVQSCPCCRVAISSPGAGFSFARGFSAAFDEQRLFTLPSTSCGGRYSMVVLDMNGDGQSDLTYSDSTGIGVLDGRTGKPCLDGSGCEPCINGTSGPDCELNPAATPLMDLGSRGNASHCLGVDLEADGRDELICLQNNGPAEDPDAAHRLFALAYVDPGQSQGAHLEMRWRVIIGERPRLVAFGAEPVSDLDADGLLEIMASGALADGETWVTYILDAESGEILAEIPDQQIVGVLDLDDGAGKRVLTSADNTLFAWSFERASEPQVASRWSLPESAAVAQIDLERAAQTWVAGHLVASDVTGDGRADLIARGTESGGRLTVYDMQSGVPVMVASYATNPTVEILTAWAAPALAGESARMLMATSDGIMRVLGAGLLPQARGLRFGGYYPRGDWRNLEITAVTGDLGTGADSVLITDARGALVRIDAREATRNVPPRIDWSLPRTSSPIIVPGIDDGDAGIVCRATLVDGQHQVQVVAGDGTVLRSFDVGGQLLSDIVPARIDGDDVPDLYIQWGEPGILDLHIQALSGANLDSIHHLVPPFEGTTRFPAGGAVLDFDGDGADDFVHQYYRTQVISGASGEILAETENNGLYFMPMVVDIDDDPAPEFVLQGGFDSIRALDADLAPLWQSAIDDRPYPYGALGRCADGTSYLVEGSLARPATVSRTNLDPAAAQNGEPVDVWSLVLAGGQGFESEALALAEVEFLGQLTSTVVHENLRGDGRPIALLGSEDGFLYGIDVCQGELAFSVAIGASVGAIAFGDTDGDGTDEVLVAAANGYLYALDNQSVTAPGWVIDTDPPRGILDEDVDLLRSGGSMSALWQAVAGADGYEIAIVHAESGTFVTEPPWQEVGDVTRATVSGIDLDYQEEYLFLVRALVGGQRSFDTASDGVQVELGYRVGCGCRGMGTGDAGILVLLVLVAPLLRRRSSGPTRTATAPG